MTKICILTTAHPVDDVRVDQKIGRSFLNADFLVTWVGPNYSYFDHVPDKRYDYRTFRTGGGRIGRLINIYRAYRRAGGIPNVDTFYAPDPDAAFIAVRIAKKQGAKAIFDIHEVYHKAMLNRWIGSRGARLFGRLVKTWISWACKRCDLVIGVSDAVLAPYKGISRESFVVRNCPPRSFASGAAADPGGNGREHFTIMHGKNTPDRGTDVVLETLKILKDRGAGVQVVMFDTANSGTPAGKMFREKIEILGLKDEIDLRRGISYGVMPAVLRCCDAGMIVYGRALGEASLPNRLFEFMAVGLPVVAPSYSREIVNVIEKGHCGLTVDAESPYELADAICFLIKNPDESREMGRRARESFLEKYNWESEIEPLMRRVRSVK